MEYVAKMMQVVTRARANTCHLKTGVGQQDWTECEDRTAKGLQRLLRQRVRELRAARQRSELYEQKQQQKPSLSLPIIHGDAYHGHLDNSHRSIPDCLQQDSISSIKEKATADSITSKDRVFELDVYRRCDQALLERWTIQYTPSVTHHHSNKQNTSSETDETEFILLAQSLFSQVRLLPVQSALHDAILAKNDLGCAIRLLGMEEALTDDDDDYEELNNTLHPRWVVSNSELTVYPFRPAVALRGALKVSLLYDPSVGGLRDVNRHKTLPKGASRHDYNRLSNSPSLPTPPSASTPSISVNQQHTSWSNSQPREIRPS
ncbi:hypothetical protein BDF19DRAFT_414806 [Syncephalis fuscata]|nr:hypothetical protein BDF19DRAFT_414806 [Syncephalis fuscata]